MTLGRAYRLRTRQAERVAAIGAMYLYDLGLGYAVTAPTSAILSHAINDLPGGERALFRAGGLPLLDLLVHSPEGASAVAASARTTAIVGIAAGLFPLAALLLAVVGSRAPEGAEGPRGGLFPRATALAPRLGLLAALFWAFEALVLGAAFIVFEMIDGGGGVGAEVSATIRAAAAMIPFALLLLVLGAAHDVFRVSVAREGTLRRGFFPALGAFRRPGTIFGRYALALVLSTVLAGGGALAGHAFGDASTTATFAAVAVLHQVAILGRVLVRAGWLGAAARVVGRDEDTAPDDQPVSER